METNSKKKTRSSSPPKADSFIWRDISQSDLSEMWLEVNRDTRERNTSLIPIVEIKCPKPASSQTPIQIVGIKSPKPASSRAPIGTRKSNRKGAPHPGDAGKK